MGKSQVDVHKCIIMQRVTLPKPP